MTQRLRIGQHRIAVEPNHVVLESSGISTHIPDDVFDLMCQFYQGRREPTAPGHVRIFIDVPEDGSPLDLEAIQTLVFHRLRSEAPVTVP